MPGEDEYAHEYTLCDRLGRNLGNLGGIHLLELKKFTAERIETEEQRWLRFFKEGEQLDDTALPDWMNTEEMRQAMNTLKLFSEKERDYFAYQARQDFLREQRTLQAEREEMLREMELVQQELERERMEKQAALQREQSAQAEIERLKALLAQSNQNP